MRENKGRKQKRLLGGMTVNRLRLHCKQHGRKHLSPAQIEVAERRGWLSRLSR